MIEGSFFDGRRSVRHPARLLRRGELIAIEGEDGWLQGETPIHGLEVSSRLGNTPRIIRFADGGVFETGDNDAIDRLLAETGGAAATLLHRLESSKRAIVLSLLALVLFVWGVVVYGIPAVSRSAAFALPTTTVELISGETLTWLDRQLFSPSELPEASRERLERRFAPLIARYQGGHTIAVLFRHGNALGANALALPSGTVIFTDELVGLSRDERELEAILLHEMAHVVGRHSLRQTLQGSMLSLLAVLAVGDVSSLSSMVTAIPVLLTQLGYSREFEGEADRFAVAAMREQGLALSHFEAILARLDATARCGKGEKGCEQETSGVNDYLSTHPPTSERLEGLRLLP